MAVKNFSLVRVSGLRTTARRSIAFLTHIDVGELNAADVFKGLDGDKERLVRTRFDHWIDGYIQDNYYHGWPNVPKWKYCFVFKWKNGRVNHRLYGFLFNPQDANPRFQVCILCSHTTKQQHDTDARELDRAMKLRSDPDVIAAIRRAFPNVPLEGGKKWIN
jgi:hypothetical protein